MTDEELKALVASLAVGQKETEQLFKETDGKFQETREQFQETRKQFQEIRELFRESAEERKKSAEERKKVEQEYQEIRELFRESAEARKKNAEEAAEERKKNAEEAAEARKKNAEETAEDRKKSAEERKKVEQEYQEIRELFKENAEERKKTDKQLKELGQQIGGLNNKFGSYTEGLAFSSMDKILENLGMDFISRRAKRKRNGRMMEVDVLGYSNTKANTVYVVEVKSLLNEDAIAQTLNTLQQFPLFFVEHRDKALYGILAYVDSKQGGREKAFEAGLYTANIQEELFELQTPEGFVPKNFQN